MRVYAVWNGKGGTGKTTTAVNLAYNLSVLGQKVLLVDLDPQTNATRFFTKANENAYTVRNLFRELFEHPEKVKRCIYRSKYPLLDVIKGDTHLSEADAHDDYTIKDALWNVKAEYDAVVIDCRPSFENLTRNALCAADILLTPIQLDGYCKDNLALVQRMYDEILADYPDHEIGWKVFVNRVKLLKSSRNIYSELMTKYTYPLVTTCVSDRAAVSSATVAKKPLLKHRKNDAATEDFMSLTKELTGVL